MLAKRSRRKKKEYLKELETQVSEMKAENSYLWEHVTEICLKLNNALADKKILEADNETLRAKGKQKELTKWMQNVKGVKKSSKRNMDGQSCRNMDVKKSYCQAKNKESLNRDEMLIIEALSGLTASSISYPSDLARKCLMVGALQGKCPPHMHGSCTIRNRQEQGVMGLYRGWGASCLQVMPSSGITWMFSEAWKDILLREQCRVWPTILVRKQIGLNTSIIMIA
nr:probable mitochondrial adenine nucleotide transporter BTL1 [Ipomoea batatas]